MAVKRCPRCGDLYLAAVDVCADCGEVLVEVEEQPAAASEPEAASSAAGDHDVWELDTWTMEGRRLLDGMLANAEIPRVWQGGSLLTPLNTHDQVDAMVSEVARGDARVGLDDRTLAAVDSVDSDTVGYEVSDWDRAALDRLARLLGRDGVPFGWDDDGDLVVAAAHEATVDAIFAELSGDGDDQAADDDGGADAHETLSAIFLAADRIARNALDAAATRSLTEAGERAAAMRLPFGFSPAVWTAIVDGARSLSDDLRSDDVDDDEIEVRAAALRELLRDYV